MYPQNRLRRLRRNETIRSLMRETHLLPSNFIQPLFIREGENVRVPISSMPGQAQLSIDLALKAIELGMSYGVSSALLFGIPSKKDLLGSDAMSKNGIIQKAVRSIKKRFPEVIIFTDLCFCEYTSHGHCGVLEKKPGGLWDVNNDATLDLIRKAALVQAEAGADFISPSGMMDGAVAAIRGELDKKGFYETGIMAYSAKFASVFYGPFRRAVESAPQTGDRKTYQMDPANAREALREAQFDIDEGADMIMVKPALAFLDVIARIRQMSEIPLVAYNVSGEYAMVKAAQEKGWVGSSEKPDIALEMLTAMKRAGADLIITYHALEVARVLSGKN